MPINLYTPKPQFNYISPVSLWLLVLDIKPTGKASARYKSELEFRPYGVAGMDNKPSLLVFFSALDACIVLLDQARRGKKWKRVPIEEFDLNSWPQTLTEGVPMSFSMGFVANSQSCLLSNANALKLLHVDNRFQIAGYKLPLTLMLPQQQLDYVRARWTTLGLMEHMTTIKQTNELSDSKLQHLATTALKQVVNTDAGSKADGNYWSVFDPKSLVWCHGSQEVIEPSNLH
jgi:hypothetical protein